MSCVAVALPLPLRERVGVRGLSGAKLRASSSAKWSGLRMWLRLWITRQCYPQAWFMPLCGASPS
jgi:hypothetical protein